MSVENRYKKYKNAGKQEKFKIREKRVKFKKGDINNEKAQNGLVVSTIGSVNLVKDDNDEIWECIVSGVLKTSYEDSNLVAVGDIVKFVDSKEISQSSKLKKGVIKEIGKRKSKLSRVSPKNKHQEQVIVSNAEYMLIYMSAEDPPYNKRLIDRYIVSAKCGDITPIICINKIDLVEDPQEVYDDLFAYYEELNIDCHLISLYDKINRKALKEQIKDKTTVISGPSGVGKSSFINYLLEDKIQQVSEISGKTSKGLHTTSFVRMFDLPFGGRIIDTPGIREFALWDVTKEELESYFDDFLEFNDNCKFLPCTHTHEPGCAIKEAVEEGNIDPERYLSYLNILETLEK